MIKYIVKRILLSIIILLGVSLIIYFLVRLMPADYLETKYSQQLAQGTITQEQVDQFKKDSGLYMPDGYLTITIDDENSDYNGLSFTRDIKDVNYTRVQEGNMFAHELYAGDYYTDDEKWQLEIQKSTDDASNGRYILYQRASGETVTKTGTFSVNGDKVTFSGISFGVSLSAEEGSTSGRLIFTVNDVSSAYNGQTFFKEVSVADWQHFQSGDADAMRFLRGEYFTHDEKLRLTLTDDGNYSISELAGMATAVHSGTYNVLGEEETHGPEYIYEIQFSGFRTKTIEYKKATVGQKAGAVLGGYFSWLWNMLRGNFGRSFTYEKAVTSVIADHMWISFIISFIALIFEFIIAIPLGITSATHQYSARDYTVTVITMVGISFPSFFFSALLVKLFSSTLGWFPTTGLVSGGSSATGFARFADMAWHLTLPMVVMVVLSIGSLMRYTRTNMLEVLNSDYIRTARAKGLSEKRVVYVHAFRNTLIPLMTMMAGILPSLFGGAMITEEVFAIDGIGRIAYKSLTQGDLPLIMGYNMFLAVLTVIGTLFSDIMYAVVDPRVKLTK